MNQDNDIDSLISNAIKNIKSTLDVNTVVGSPIKVSQECTIIPITKISAGFVAGGGEYPAKKIKNKMNDNSFAGGTGSGFCITPIGFVFCNNADVKIITMDNKPLYENVIELLNNLIKQYKQRNNKDKKSKGA